jgi:hypothetical protein
MATKKVLVLTPQKKVMTEADKTQLTVMFESLITDYKKKFIEAMPNKKENYIVNFYSKFYRGFFYLCAEYKAEYENRILDGFEEKFARLEFVETNRYNLAYYRHTGQWWTVENNVTPEFCLECITNNPLFFIC